MLTEENKKLVAGTKQGDMNSEKLRKNIALLENKLKDCDEQIKDQRKENDKLSLLSITMKAKMIEIFDLKSRFQTTTFTAIFIQEKPYDNRCFQ